jgi:FeS assembly SUF system protein
MREKIIAALSKVFDPEIPMDIYSLGLIYDVKVNDAGEAYIKMTLTAPNCPVAGTLPAEVERKARAVPGVKDVKLELTFDPPWDKSRMSPEARMLLGLDDIIPIGNLSRMRP